MVSSEFADRPLKKLVLFDVDGPLTLARQPAQPEVIEVLKELRKKVVIGFVGGSDLVKISEQLSVNGEKALDLFDYGFAENGLTAYRLGQPIESQSFIKFLGEEKYKPLVNFILHYVADLDIPIKRGTFVEFRNGMINVSPIGRNATIAERLEFNEYDKVHGIRPAFIKVLKEKFPDYGLTYSIGGQISFDIFPHGWDKTYALRHVEHEGFEEIHFFGDKTSPLYLMDNIRRATSREDSAVYDLRSQIHTNSPSHMVVGTSPTADDSEHSVLEDDSDAEMDRDEYEEDELMDEDDDDGSSSLSIPNESIDFDLVYSLHSFAATVEGQANVVKGDSLFLMDDSNSYWWLVRVLKTQEVGYIPAENIETPFERLARLNKHRNVDLASATHAELQDGLLQSQDRLRQNLNNSRQGRTDSPSQSRPLKSKTVDFNVDRSFYRYPPAVWHADEELDDFEDEEEDEWDVGEYYEEDPVLMAEKAAQQEVLDRANARLAAAEAVSGQQMGMPGEHEDEMKWEDSPLEEVRMKPQEMSELQQSLQSQQQSIRASPSPARDGIAEQPRVSPTAQSGSISSDNTTTTTAPLSVSTGQNGERRLVADPFSEFDMSPNSANPSSPTNSSSTHETVKLTMTPTIARDNVFESQQATAYDPRKRRGDEEDSAAAEDARKRAKNVVSPPPAKSGPSSSGGGKLRKERDRSDSAGTRSLESVSGSTEDDSSSNTGKDKDKKKKSGVFGALFGRKKDKKEGSKDLRDTAGMKDSKSSASMDADIVVGPNMGRISEETGRRPSASSQGTSVESGMVSPTTAMAMQQQQPMVAPSTPPHNQHPAGSAPGGSTSYGSLASMSSTSTPPSSLTSSPAAQTLRQRDQAQQALYQQYLNRSPASAPDPNYGLQSASVVNAGARWGRERDPMSGTSTTQPSSSGLAPPTQRQRPGSLILTSEALASHPISALNASSSAAVSPSAAAPPIAELSVVRIFAGRGLEEETEATFKTVLLNSQTTAGDLVGQAVQRFRLNVPSDGHSTDEEEEAMDDPSVKRAKLIGPSRYYFLTIKQIEGGASVKLKPDEKPLVVFESLVEDARLAREEREREERERLMSTPKVKRSSVGSISSVTSNLSMHPAIKKLPMNDFTDDSAVKFYIHRKGVDPDEDEEYDEVLGYRRFSTEEGDDTMVAADTSMSSNLAESDSGAFLSPSSSGSSKAMERLLSPALRFSLQLDLPDDMVFDTVTEAIIFKGTLKDRERDSRRHSHASSVSNTSSSIPQNFRRKIFVFPKNVTVAEVIELGLERFGILEGVVDGGDEVEDKLTKRRSNAARVRYGLSAMIGDSERDLSPASRIIDSYPRPPTFRAAERDRNRSKDLQRRSIDSAQILGNMDDLSPDDPVFVLRRATSYKTSTSKHRMSAPLDELALRNLHQQLNRDSISSSTRGGTDSTPISPNIITGGFADQQRKDQPSRKEIIAAQREASRATQRAMLSTQANAVRGVDVLLPGNARLRSARVDADDKMRYSYVQPDGETYDISDIVEEEWRGGEYHNKDSQKRDLLENVVTGRAGAGEKLDRILGRIKNGKSGLQPPGSASQQGLRSGSPSSQYSLDETVEAYGRSRSVTPAGTSMASVTSGPKVVGQVNRAASPASTAGGRMSPSGQRPGTVTPTAAAGDRPDNRRNPSIASVMSDMSGYATPATHPMTPSPIDNEVPRSAPGTPKMQAQQVQHQRQRSAGLSTTGKKTPVGRPLIPKDDFGVSQMMAIIEYRASKNKGTVAEAPIKHDPVDDMLFGRQLDLATLHPKIRDIYADSFREMDEVDKYLDDQLLRIQAARQS
ncbi:protein phosphatase regulator [Marasmius tenuissimus]|uniref:phosphomannomutase n=1 Tax=Marasmius tenuissimus TaxID=585030 RepID=A0ABR2ZIQ3_9AGAR